VLTRAGYAGVQRYAAVWTGDNVASWEHLALTIPMLTNLSISGVPFVGADVGGFVGSPSAELYTRWLQAAALTPFFRTHAEIGSRDREPWSYGEEFERINRATIELRYQLLPYIYTLFAKNEASGQPVLRPLWFDHPNDLETLLLDDEFLLGKDLLAAPVLQEGATQRRVYFPQGDTWIDWWDGTRHAGGTFAEIPAPIDRLPLFLRAGAAIATQPTIQHTGEMKGVPLTIAVALGADGTSTIHEDSGDGYAYRKGDSRDVQIELHAETLKLRIAATNRFQRIGFVEFLGLDKAPASVRADGKVLRDAAFDAKSRRLHVALPNENVRGISLTH
jgi:alpha-glucosidase